MRDMEESLDIAARVSARLKEELADLIADGTIDFITPGSTGVLHGEHHPKIGLHLTIDRKNFPERKDELLERVRSFTDQGVEIVFFPA